MTDAPLLVALANAGAVLRPTGARTRSQSDPLRDAEAAGEFLEGFLARQVNGDELPGLRALQHAVAEVVHALLDGNKPVPLDDLNRLAAGHRGAYALEQRPDCRLAAAIRLDPAPAAAMLATGAIRELGALDPTRLRRCARAECSLVFYDTTRSGTRRWHSNSPCGLRERQRRHRARAA